MGVENLSESLQSVARAHRLLSDFNREVAALFQLIDEQLGSGSTVQLEALDDKNAIILDVEYRLKDASAWCPRWLGRFYKDTRAYPAAESDYSGPITYEKLATAFVWIAAAPQPSELKDASGPECIIGIAHTGTGSNIKHLYEPCRHGIWKHLPHNLLPRTGWLDGQFTPMTGKFGTDPWWLASRVPLAELVDAAAVQQKVSTPILERFEQKFRGHAEQTTSSATGG